jgi:formamidopyrimidine-DNA glycosylase
MPEGPEAWVSAQILRSRLVGKSILGWHQVVDYRLNNFHKLQCPSIIQHVYSRGKRPVFQLDKGWLVTFLGMTGKWLFEPGKHTKIVLTIGTHEIYDDMIVENPEFYLYFNDQRPFGFIDYLETQMDYDIFFSRMGLDFMNQDVTFEQFRACIRSAPPNMEICKFLLESKYISSIGNYLRAEGLWYSRIRPNRPLQSISDIEIETMLQVFLWLHRYSASMGGYTIEDFLSPDGTRGSYEAVCYSKGHSRKFDPYGNPIEKSVFSDKRSIYWAPNIQL